MRLAFTGTRLGMTERQENEVRRELTIDRENKTPMGSITAVHGCCKGADVDFHRLALEAGIPFYDLWPSNNRATNRLQECMDLFAKFELDPGVVLTLHPENEPLLRNEDIIAGADFLIACPKETEEVLRSGTWATIRLARKYNVPMAIIFP